MNKIFILSKAFLKNGSEGFGKSKGRKGISRVITLVLILGLLIMSLGIPFGMFVESAYDMLAPAGQSGIIVGFGLSVVSVTIFIFGIFYVLTTFYFSKDIENLLPLPVKPYEILSAKFVTVLVYEYFTELVILLPVIIGYGIKSGGGIIYYLYSLIVFLTLPIIPLVIASIIDMVIMRFTNLGKHKDILKIVGGLLAISVSLGVNVFMQSMGSKAGENPEQMMKLMLEGRNSLVGLSTRLFPSSKISAWALIENGNLKGLQNLIIFLFITAVFMVLFMVLAEILYLRGVVGVSESYSKRKKMDSQELDKNLGQSSAVRSYTIKELRLLVRTPSYFINCVLMNFLLPLFLLIPIASQPKLMTQLSEMDKYAKNPTILGVALAAVFAFALFLSGSTGITSTSISREGQNIYVGKYLPMRYKDQIFAKVFSGVILNSIGVVIALIVVSVIARPELLILFLAAVVGIFGVVMMSFSGILVDLHFPKLNWDNEQRAVKQNFNLIINMLLGVAVAVAAVFGTVKLGLSLWQAFWGIIFASSIINFMLFKILSTYGEKLYRQIEA